MAYVGRVRRINYRNDEVQGERCNVFLTRIAASFLAVLTFRRGVTVGLAFSCPADHGTVSAVDDLGPATVSVSFETLNAICDHRRRL